MLNYGTFTTNIINNCVIQFQASIWMFIQKNGWPGFQGWDFITDTCVWSVMLLLMQDCIHTCVALWHPHCKFHTRNILILGPIKSIFYWYKYDHHDMCLIRLRSRFEALSESSKWNIYEIRNTMEHPGNLWLCFVFKVQFHIAVCLKHLSMTNF